MRLLLIPHTGLKNIRGDSNYLLFLDLAKHLIAQGHFCYMLMPEFAKDDVERFPGLMYVWRDYGYDYYTEYHIIDPRHMVDLFSRRAGSEVIDGVITSKAALIPQIKALISDFIRCRDVECIHVEPGVFDKESGASFTGTMDMVLTSLGYSYGIPGFLTEYEKERGIKIARKYLSPHVLRRIEEDSIVQPVGLDCDKIDELTKDVEQSKRFTLFFGGRLNSVKQPERIVEVYDHFYRYGRSIDVVISTNTGYLPHARRLNQLFDGREHIEVHYEVGKADYLKLAKRSHVFMCWSTSEGFPVGFWEQMYLGLIGLFTNKKWAVKQLPDNYPWIFSGKTEAYAMLMDIYDNYEVRRKALEWLPGYIRDKYGFNRVYGIIEQKLLDKLKLRKSYRMTRGVMELVDHVLPFFGDNPFSLPQLLELMEKEGRSFTVDQKMRSQTMKYPTNYDIYRHILSLGYKDQCRSNVPVFEKGEVMDSE
jgi:hypothetical protein